MFPWKKFPFTRRTQGTGRVFICFWQEKCKAWKSFKWSKFLWPSMRCTLTLCPYLIVHLWKVQIKKQSSFALFMTIIVIFPWETKQIRSQFNETKICYSGQRKTGETILFLEILGFGHNWLTRVNDKEQNY